ncbi:MAG TPA: hypothetical protein PKU97_13265 [Kofleriaceae bacterium]|nr:hypothetical protein [Kofleriaceae bacterium]
MSPRNARAYHAAPWSTLVIFGESAGRRDGDLPATKPGGGAESGATAGADVGAAGSSA